VVEIINYYVDNWLFQKAQKHEKRGLKRDNRLPFPVIDYHVFENVEQEGF